MFLEQIENSLDIFDSNLHDLPRRQRSVRAVFEHSWQLLNDNERTILGKLAVFKGGFTLDAMQDIADAKLPVVARLLNKSLIRRDPNTNRYDMHPLVGKFALEKLIVSGKKTETHYRHAVYYSSFYRDSCHC